MRKTESQKIALCGMLGALSVVLLLLGSALQIGTYAAPMLAAFLLIPVLEEYGTRYALTLYVCVAILAVLFVPETELALFYVLVMGYYPVLRVKLNGVKSTLLRWVLKFAVFNAGTVLVYLLLFALLGPAVLDELLADGIGDRQVMDRNDAINGFNVILLQRSGDGIADGYHFAHCSPFLSRTSG